MQVSMCDVVEYSLALESARSRAIETSNKGGAGSLQYNKNSLADLVLFAEYWDRLRFLLTVLY